MTMSDKDHPSSPSRGGREGRPLNVVLPTVDDDDDAIRAGVDEDHRQNLRVLNPSDYHDPSTEEGRGGPSSSPDDDLIRSALDGCQAAASSLDRDSLDRNLHHLRSILTRMRPGLRDPVGVPGSGGTSTDRGGGDTGSIVVIAEDGEGDGGDDDHRHTAAVAESAAADAIQMYRSAQQTPKNPDDIGSHVTSANESVTMSSSKPSSIAKADATMSYGKGRGDVEDGVDSVKCAERTGDKKMPVKKCPYKDYSHVPPSDSHQVIPHPANKQHKFTEKLHAVLSNPAFRDVMCWMPHGRSWRIVQPILFEEKFLPHLFGHCHLKSFLRQVNGWGFCRIKVGRDRNSYFHEMFLRGMPHLLDQMKRESVLEKKRRCNGGNARDNPPDLYRISRKNPLPEIPPNHPPEVPMTAFEAGHVDLGMSAASKAPLPPGVAAPRQLQSLTPHTFVPADGTREIGHSVLKRDHNSVVDSMTGGEIEQSRLKRFRSVVDSLTAREIEQSRLRPFHSVVDGMSEREIEQSRLRQDHTVVDSMTAREIEQSRLGRFHSVVDSLAARELEQSRLRPNHAVVDSLTARELEQSRLRPSHAVVDSMTARDIEDIRLKPDRSFVDNMTAREIERSRLGRDHSVFDRMTARDMEQSRLGRDHSVVDNMTAREIELGRLKRDHSFVDNMTARDIEQSRLKRDHSVVDNMTARDIERSRLRRDYSVADSMTAREIELSRLRRDYSVADSMTAREIELSRLRRDNPVADSMTAREIELSRLRRDYSVADSMTAREIALSSDHSAVDSMTAREVEQSRLRRDHSFVDSIEAGEVEQSRLRPDHAVVDSMTAREIEQSRLKPDHSVVDSMTTREIEQSKPKRDRSVVDSITAREIEQSRPRRDRSVADSMTVMPSKSRNSQSTGLLGSSYATKRWPRSEDRIATIENRLMGILAQERQSMSRIPIAASTSVDQDLDRRTEAPRSLSNIPIGASSADATLGFRTEAAPWLDPHFGVRRSRLGGTDPAQSPNANVLLSDAEYYRLKADRWPRL